MKLKLYLAARYGRRQEMLEHREELIAKGHSVTSRWLIQHDQTDIHHPNAHYDEAQRRMFAMHDYADVIAADGLIAFTEPRDESSPGGKRGGRHVELGIALALGKFVFVVGYRENVFCHLPQVAFYETFNALLEDL